jgi:hypothetical protein
MNDYFPDSKKIFNLEREKEEEIITTNICYICQIENDIDSSIKLICGHTFHKECLSLNIDSIVSNYRGYKLSHPIFNKCPYCSTIDNNINVVVSKQTTNNTRKAPNALAKKFPVGKIQLSENDQKNYIVYADKNNVKKWKKYKN